MLNKNVSSLSGEVYTNPRWFEKYARTNGIHFKASQAGSSVNIFTTSSYAGLNNANLKVYINGALTSLSYYSLTFSAGDDVLIKLLYDNQPYAAYFPPLSTSFGAYVKEMVEPLPLLKTDYYSPVYSFASLFQGATALKTVPEKVLWNNPQVSDFSYLFSGCTALTSVPEKLFSHSSNARTLAYAFQTTSALKSIPNGLFRGLDSVTAVDYIFQQSKIAKIPEGIFKDMSHLATATYAFANCTAVTSLPDQIFARKIKTNTATISFKYLFSGCTGLTSATGKSLNFDVSKLDGYASTVNYEIRFDYVFNGCSKLTSVGGDLLAFDSPKYKVYFNYLFKGTKLVTVPEGLFDKCLGVNIVDYTSAFASITTLTTVPRGIFRKALELCTATCTLTSCFNGCSALEGTIEVITPATSFTASNFVAGCKSVINVYVEAGTASWVYFSGNKTNMNLKYLHAPRVPTNGIHFIPAKDMSSTNLFYDTDIVPAAGHKVIINGVETTQLYSAITAKAGDDVLITVTNDSYPYPLLYTSESSRSTYIKEVVEPLPSMQRSSTSYPNSASYFALFTANTNLEKIPAGMYGNLLFGSYDIANLFQGCTRLTEIPEGVFDGCYAYQGVLSYPFSGCINIKAIPRGVFDGLENVTSITYGFNGCTALSTGNEPLYTHPENVKKLVSLAYLFNGCTTLAKAGKNIFKGLKTLTNLSYAFSGCINLVELEDGLLDDQENLSTLDYFVNGCTGLTIVPEHLLRNNLKLRSMNYTFNGCSLLKLKIWIYTQYLGMAATTYGIEDYVGNITNMVNGCSSSELHFPLWGWTYMTLMQNKVGTKRIPEPSLTKYYSPGMHFISAVTGNIAMFNSSHTTPTSAIEVWINGTLHPEYTYKSFYTNEGDEVLLKLVDVTQPFPCANSGNQYIREVLSRWPSVCDTSNVYYTSTHYKQFANNKVLKKLPKGLFDNVYRENGYFDNAFQNCFALEEIPEDLLWLPLSEGLEDPVPGGSYTYYYTFQNCYALKNVPKKLFKFNCGASSNRYEYVFNACYALSGEIYLYGNYTSYSYYSYSFVSCNVNNFFVYVSSASVKDSGVANSSTGNSGVRVAVLPAMAYKIL